MAKQPANFKKNAKDGDNDGIVQDGTEYERPVKVKKTDKVETVALFSIRNIFWQEVGRISRGYNIVTNEAAEKWLTKDGIRVATPEEVAREYGV